MHRKIKLKGQLKSYVQWPILLTILLIVMNIWIYLIDIEAGGLMSIFVVIYIIISMILYLYNRPLIMNEIISFATEYGQVQKQLLNNLEIPYGILDQNNKLIWMNKEFAKIIHKDKKYKKSITNIFPEVTKDMITMENSEAMTHISYENKDYRVNLKKIILESMGQSSTVIEFAEEENYLIALYLFDETEINKYIQENNEQKLVAGLIYIDNYEEALESIEEVRRSLLIALVDRKINQFISNVDGIVKKLEKDKYFVVLRQKYLNQLQADKFSILDEVKSVNIGNEMSVTLSLGLGMNGSTYNQNYEFARTAMDLALGRGGDQAVLKDNEKIYYYGGKSKQVEKQTRVKARVKAHALRELMESKDKVVVMGHKLSDVDSFGAAIGIYRAAKAINKKVSIVINEISSSVRPLMEGFLNNPDYESDMFITGSQAMDLVDINTVVVVVDVNRPSFTECQELLYLSRTIVVLDHHRRSNESIENAVLSYIETYASSTCEMVAEILQYFDEKIKIKNMEADCIYAGIVIDTNNFMSKTGVRTFEAAAFLRRCGADVTRVRKMFRNDIDSYKARAEAVRHAEVFEKCYAISFCPSEGIESPTIVGAQAANELLNITGIRASFVLTDYHDTIYVSARSIDDVNVQLIMEKLGGGGHMNIAGAQLEGSSIDSAIELIKELIENMIEEGDL